MMRKTFLLIILLCSYLVHFGQTPKTVALADDLLKSGTFKAALVAYEFPSDIQALQSKAVKNLKANPEWADKYIVFLVQRGAWQDLKFMDAYGLTRPEFDKMIAGFRQGMKSILKDKFDITITKANGIITFKAASGLQVYNYLSIDVNNKTVTFDNRLLRKELELRGKFYAPALFGYEVFNPMDIQGKKQQTKYGSVAFAVGKNTGDNKTTLSLVLHSTFTEMEYFIITIL